MKKRKNKGMYNDTVDFKCVCRSENNEGKCLNLYGMFINNKKTGFQYLKGNKKARVLRA